MSLIQPLSFTDIEPFSFTLPLWADLHAHFRQDALLPVLARAHTAMGCYAVLGMPNTRPPLLKVLNSGPYANLDGWSVEDYNRQLVAAFDYNVHVITPLYITEHTTPGMIEEGARSGWLKAAKYYPPGGTTNSDDGFAMQKLLDTGVLAAMEREGVVLCIHGEEHFHACGADYFDKDNNAETRFYKEYMPYIRDRYPNLKIVCEHITTKVARDFVLESGPNVVATITPQHMMYTVGDLLQGWLAHLNCRPVVKFDEDARALCEAVLDPNNTKFFAGTDSAPHESLSKATPCGCATGCYTGGIAPQLYAEALTRAGADFRKPEDVAKMRRFMCEIGPDFYGLPRPPEGKVIVLTRDADGEIVRPVRVAGIGTIIPLPLGMDKDALAKEIARMPFRLSLSTPKAA